MAWSQSHKRHHKNGHYVAPKITERSAMRLCRERAGAGPFPAAPKLAQASLALGVYVYLPPGGIGCVVCLFCAFVFLFCTPCPFALCVGQSLATHTHCRTAPHYLRTLRKRPSLSVNIYTCRLEGWLVVLCVCFVRLSFCSVRLAPLRFG